jgi:hypothetical protein
LKGAGKTDWNFKKPETPFDSSAWTDVKAHQPFYAQVNIKETPRTYNTDSSSQIDPAKVVLPPSVPDHPVARNDVLKKEVGWLK